MISRGLLAVLFGQVKLSCFTQKNEADLSVRWQKMPTHQQQSQQKNQPQKSIFLNFTGIWEKIFLLQASICVSLSYFGFFFFFFWHMSVCLHVDSPMIVTSYSIWNRASWPHWANTLRASLWFALCSGTPSTLRRRSPGRRVPSLHADTHTHPKKWHWILWYSDYRRQGLDITICM